MFVYEDAIDALMAYDRGSLYIILAIWIAMHAYYATKCLHLHRHPGSRDSELMLHKSGQGRKYASAAAKVPTSTNLSKPVGAKPKSDGAQTTTSRLSYALGGPGEIDC